MQESGGDPRRVETGLPELNQEAEEAGVAGLVVRHGVPVEPVEVRIVAVRVVIAFLQCAHLYLHFKSCLGRQAQTYQGAAVEKLRNLVWRTQRMGGSNPRPTHVSVPDLHRGFIAPTKAVSA